MYSDVGVDFSVGDPSYWNVTAGGDGWGKELDGQIADVSIHDEVRDINPSQTVYERMYEMDQGSAGGPELPQPIRQTSDAYTTVRLL